MNKIIFSLLLLVSSNTFSQGYYHGAGFNISLNNYRFIYDDPVLGRFDNSRLNFLPSLVYKASYGIILKSDFYFAASAYPAIGAMYSSNSNSQSGQTTSSYFGYDLPLLGEFYFGSLDDNAFHFGVGYDISSFRQNGVGRTTHGPQLSFGGQLFVRDQLYHIRFFYTKGLNKTKDIPSGVDVITDQRNYFGGSLIYMFGI
jgi:hypothetical protein